MNHDVDVINLETGMAKPNQRVGEWKWKQDILIELHKSHLNLYVLIISSSMLYMQVLVIFNANKVKCILTSTLHVIKVLIFYLFKL